jgi:hypothetical protein
MSFTFKQFLQNYVSREVSIEEDLASEPGYSWLKGPDSKFKEERIKAEREKLKNHKDPASIKKAAELNDMASDDEQPKSVQDDEARPAKPFNSKMKSMAKMGGMKNMKNMSEGILSEILDSEIEYSVDMGTHRCFVTSTNIGDRKVIFNAHQEEPTEWEIEFVEQLPNGKKTFSGTGSGSALQVGAFVKKSVIEFVQRYTPSKITFTAENDTRAKIYKKVLDQVLSGYDCNIERAHDSILFQYTLK